MKRLWLLPILVGLLFASAPLGAQQADLRPDYGMLNGRRYMNGYFGFSYRFPEGWNGSALRYPAVGESKMYPLFSANPQAASTSDVRYVSINADYLAPNTSVKAPKDFLEIALNAQAGPTGEFEALHTDKRYLFGGRQFYRVDMKAKPSPGTPVFYQTLICTILRNYAITFSFMAANDDDMEELVRTMESLSFIEPGQMAGSQNMIAGQQTAPASNNTSSTSAGRAPSTLVPATAENRPSEAVQPQIQSGTPETTSAQPAVTPSPVATPSAKTSPPPTKTTRKATATVSSSASEVPTTEIPLNQVASNLPVVEAEAVPPVPSAATVPVTTNTLGSSTSASPEPANQRQSSEISPARNSTAPASSGANSIPSSRSAAPSTLISMGRAPQNSSPAAEPASQTQATHTAPSTQHIRTETTSAPSASSTPAQPVRETVTPEATALTDSSKPKLQPATEVASSQPTVQPAVERVPVEPNAAPVAAAITTPPAASSGKGAALTRIYVPPAELDQYILRKTPPVYPMIAKAAGVGGMVVLDIIVDGKGNLQKVTTITGSALLARAAEEALRQWRFKPYVVDGNPVEMESQIAMNFRLTK